VFLGLGRAEAVAPELPGMGLNGVCFAHHFVARRACDGQSPSGSVAVKGRRVVVLGGGDTAMDALRTAIRCGAAEAVCVYRRDASNMAADAEEYANAVEEGAQFQFLAQPVAFRGCDAGRVTAMRCVRTELGEADKSGRRSFRVVAGSEFDIPADLVLVAYGFTAPRLPLEGGFEDLATDLRGRVEIDDRWMTNLEGVFAGGSLVRGAAPLAEAVRDARAGAASIDRYLAARRAAGSATQQTSAWM
jgi:glutamate synthase (NADPH/NADH) small chain